MGLFDSIGKAFSGDDTLTPRVAMTLAGISMIAADGEIEGEELAAISALNAVTPDSYKRALKLIRKTPTIGAIPEMVSEVLSEKQRLSVLFMLLDIAMSDGKLDGAEEALFQRYLTAFGIPADAVKPAVSVLLIKNHPTLFNN